MTPPSPARDGDAPPGSLRRELLSRITRLEVLIGAAIAAVMVLLILIEPNILEAPFENERTLLFTFGGTALAAVAGVAMLWFRVPAPVRVIVLVAPFAVVNWWLISPYFIDEVVDESFSTSISEQVVTADDSPVVPAEPATPEAGVATTAAPARQDTDAPATTESLDAESAAVATPAPEEPVALDAPTEGDAPPAPSGPVLLGAGRFVGLAGHDGAGDAGLFQNPDGSLVLRFENFDIENGPDLEVYLIPGADQVSLSDGSIHLGPLKGNIGDQNYELAPGTELAPGAYTALVWCEAFSVEFVGATIAV